MLDARGTGTGEGLARLRLPVLAAEDAGFHLHPALMDIATGWAMPLIADYRGAALWVPVSYGTVRAFAPLGHGVWSHVRLATGTSESGVGRFDITLAGATGAMLAEVRDFTMRRQEGGLVIAPPRAGEIRFDAPAQAPENPAERRLAGFWRGGFAVATRPMMICARPRAT